MSVGTRTPSLDLGPVSGLSSLSKDSISPGISCQFRPRDPGVEPPARASGGSLHSPAASDLVPERCTLPPGRDPSLSGLRWASGRMLYGQGLTSGASSTVNLILPGTCFPPDPNDLFPEAHTLGSADSLDFRHHNYKAMRKVRSNPCDPGRRPA